ncbi:hypothetical protein Tco_0539881 [Tanacetum coccineum]
MPWCSTLKTTIPLRSCPIALLSISNICVTSTPAIAGKVPYFIALVALLGAWAIVVKMVLGALGKRSPIRLLFACAEFLIHQVVGQLNSLIQRLGSGRFDVPINVVRKSTDVLVNLLDFVGNKLGTYQGTDIKEMDKNKEKPDRTEHGIEKSTRLRV